VAEEPRLVAVGRRLVAEAATQGVAVRLLGGVAVWLRSSNGAREAFGRDYPDLDVVAHKKESRRLRDVLEAMQYEPERVFNATHGAKRLLYHAPDRSYHVDVFLDEFQMSHTLDLGARLEIEPLTLPAAELLLTKLQVAEINRKDLADASMLMLEHDLAEEDGPGKLNVARVAQACAADWGLFTTVMDNLAKLRETFGEQAPLERIAELESRLESEPKSRAWKLRAKIGRRKRWFELPEEVVR
jgi:hypothetical protein